MVEVLLSIITAREHNADHTKVNKSVSSQIEDCCSQGMPVTYRYWSNKWFWKQSHSALLTLNVKRNYKECSSNFATILSYSIHWYILNSEQWGETMNAISPSAWFLLLCPKSPMNWLCMQCKTWLWLCVLVFMIILGNCI